MVTVETRAGIIYAVFTNNSRQAVDTYIDQMIIVMEKHIASAGVNVPMRTLLDVTQSGMFSVKYASTVVTERLQAYPSRPEQFYAYVVNSMQDEAVIQMMDAILARRLQHQRRVYTADQYDAAVAWLQDRA
jgi:hypothetical protein